MTNQRAPGRTAHPGSRAPVAPLPSTVVPERRAVERPATDAEAAERPPSASFHGRMAQAIATQQALAAANARLDTKQAELERWDAAAQEKFHRAFGSTDERLRQAVLQRIEQQREKNLQLLAAITDGVNFEFYMQTKKPR
jgi:hypothetical protein